MPLKPGDIVQVRHGIDGVIAKDGWAMVTAVGYGETGRDILVLPLEEQRVWEATPLTRAVTGEVFFWEGDLILVSGIDERLRDVVRPKPPRRPWWKRLLPRATFAFHSLKSFSIPR